ncbi:MAG: Eco57I restriction-modification methylase domain-containing protein [Bacteroidota bacterium]
MDHSTAKKLIKETFETKFDQDRFRRFILDLLNDFEETPSTTYKGNTIPRAYEPYVRIMDRLGKYEDQDGNLVDVLIVHLKKESSLERARTTQRNLIGWYLNGSRGGVLKDGALVAFVSPDPQDWRFSFVKMDYEIVEKEGGGVKAEQTFTPARRFSFLVGTNEYSHTAQKQLIPILKKDSEKPSFQELEEGFSVEPVTERFYEEYRDRFLELKDELDKLVENDDAIKEDFNKHNVDTSDFAKKLMGQIVFLYFLQKKGWFGVPRGGDWGSGPKNFLRELFEKEHATYSNFFNDILEPLFYEALATQRPDDYYSRFNCKIPFLNGGLFDPIQNYDWINTDLLLPDTLFSNSDDTGILDVFDRYNFTIKENEPLEKEVAVDPEMLGKVFENLLEVEDRKSKGTYYTPREIVHYMCQESLIQHLETELGSRIPSEDIKTFVRYGEQAIENDMYVEGQDQETRRYSYDIPESIRENAEAIDEELASIRVCDPAVGSGAFLVGMMNEIVRKREVLTSYHPHVSKRNAYKFKLDAIHDSLYGVDIEPGAVEIAKLRLWLSLVVEEENIKRIHSLPNLDYKIMQGNSLLEEYEGIKLIDERFFAKPESDDHVVEQLQEQEKKIQREYIKLHQEGKLTNRKEKELQKQLKQIPKKIKQYKKQEESGFVSDLFGSDQARKKAGELLELQEEFFEASRQQEKQEIRNQIEHLTWDLIELTLIEQDKEEKLDEIKKLREQRIYPFFLWRLNFADVFQENGGFDVIIGNPPYLQIQKMDEEAEYLEEQEFKSFTKMGDIYCLFYEKANELLHTGGTCCFITSNKWMSARYGRRLRDYFLKNTDPQILIDFSKAKIFQAATVFVNILLFKKQPYNSSLKALELQDDYEKNSESLANYFQENHIKLNDLVDSNWQVTSQDGFNLIKKIERIGLPLKEWGLDFYRGITTGLNKVFLIDEATRNNLINEDPNSEEVIEPLLRGRDIKRYQYSFSNVYIIFTRQGVDIQNYPAIEEYLYQHYKDLKPKDKRSEKNGRKPGNYEWYEIQDNSAFYTELENEKIVWIEISDRANYSFDDKGMYLTNSAYFMSGDNLKYLLAVLNSKLSDYYFFQISAQIAGGRKRYTKQYVEQIPIPQIENDLQEPFKNQVNQILQAKDDGFDTSGMEEELEHMVYDLYDLNQDEIGLIEDYFENH